LSKHGATSRARSSAPVIDRAQRFAPPSWPIAIPMHFAPAWFAGTVTVASRWRSGGTVPSYATVLPCWATGTWAKSGLPAAPNFLVVSYARQRKTVFVGFAFQKEQSRRPFVAAATANLVPSQETNAAKAVLMHNVWANSGTQDEPNASMDTRPRSAPAAINLGTTVLANESSAVSRIASPQGPGDIGALLQPERSGASP
jgi:hypothetical protein